MNRLRSLLTVCVMVACTDPALALSPEARGTAMGGAMTPFASGAEGLWWNDGVLGKPLLLSGLAGFGLEGGNNALNLQQIIALAEQTPKGKADAIQAIKDKGSWDARIETAGIAGATVRGISVGVIPHAYVQAKGVSPDAAELAIDGTIPVPPAPTASQHYAIKGEYTRAVFTDIMAGYAHDLPTFIPGVSLSGGAAVKYIMGSDYDHVKTDQTFDSFAPTIPNSNSEHTNSTSGKGYGLDLGVHASMLSIVKAGLEVRNLGAKITWDTKRQVGYFDQSTLKFISHTGTGDATMTLPTTILLGGGVSLPVVGTSAGLQLESDVTNHENKFHLGVEQSFAGVFAIRAGYVTGAGPTPAQVTFGLGIGAVVAHLDVGAGMALDGKGGSAAISANVNI